MFTAGTSAWGGVGSVAATSAVGTSDGCVLSMSPWVVAGGALSDIFCGAIVASLSSGRAVFVGVGLIDGRLLGAVVACAVGSGVAWGGGGR